MEQSNTTDRRPTARTWVLGAILVIAILWVVFAMISRNSGSHNERLPKAQIPAGSMVASSGTSPGHTISSSALISV